MIVNYLIATHSTPQIINYAPPSKMSQVDSPIPAKHLLSLDSKTIGQGDIQAHNKLTNQPTIRTFTLVMLLGNNSYEHTHQADILTSHESIFEHFSEICGYILLSAVNLYLKLGNFIRTYANRFSKNTNIIGKDFRPS